MASAQQSTLRRSAWVATCMGLALAVAAGCGRAKAPPAPDLDPVKVGDAGAAGGDLEGAKGDRIVLSAAAAGPAAPNNGGLAERSKFTDLTTNYSILGDIQRGKRLPAARRDGDGG